MAHRCQEAEQKCSKTQIEFTNVSNNMIKMEASRKKARESLLAAKTKITDLMEAAKKTTTKLTTSKAAYDAKVVELQKTETSLDAEKAELHTQKLANVDLINKVKALENTNAGLVTRAAELETQNAAHLVARDGLERQVTEQVGKVVALQREAATHAALCNESVILWEAHATKYEDRLRCIEDGLRAETIYVLDGELVDLNALLVPDEELPAVDEMNLDEGLLAAGEQVAAGDALGEAGLVASAEGTTVTPVPVEGNPEEPSIVNQ